MRRQTHIVTQVLLAASLLCAPIGSANAVDDGPAQPPLFPVNHGFQLTSAAQTFDEVRELILQRYYSAAITEDALYQAAVLGMLRHISPPKTPELAKLWSAEQYETYLNSLRGIGTSAGFKSRFNADEGSLTVTDVDPDSPSDGLLRIHDRIMRIDGHALSGQPVARINQWLNRQPGESSRLTIVRDIEVLELELNFQVYDTEVLKVTALPQGLTYVELRRVTLNSAGQMASALRQAAAQGSSGVVIDLRDNGGGVFLEGLRLAEIFLGPQRVLGRTVQSGSQIKTYVSNNTAPVDLPAAILIGKTTGSAAEIFAAAMQTQKEATLVGEATFGKATMEETFKLNTGARVKFIVGALYDPLGRTWHERGVKPDFLVEDDPKARDSWRRLSMEQRIKRDTALLTAWKLLKRSPAEVESESK